MDARECLMKIIEDAANFDASRFDGYSKKKKDFEVEKIMSRWLKWISSVNEVQWDTGCTYKDEVEEENEA